LPNNAFIAKKRNYVKMTHSKIFWNFQILSFE